MNAPVHLLILNYKSGPALRACLESLRESDARDLPLLVVDNASPDDSAEGLDELWPGVRLERLEENLGFSAGVNHGMRLLEAEAPARILLLNPDTTVTADFLAPLAQALDAGASLAGPKLRLPGAPTRLWCAGGDATFGLNLCRLRGHREPDQGQHDQPCDVSFLPGTVWLFERSAWAEVGELDETYFCYLEDLDWCLRLLAAGRRVRYVPQSVVTHVGSQASGGGYSRLRKYLNAWGSWHLLRRHGNGGRWLKFLLADVASLPLLLVVAPLQGRGRGAWWKARGLWDGLRGRALSPEWLARLLRGASR